MEEKFRIIELFGGIGACTQALKQLLTEGGKKLEVVDYVEIDKYAVASYNAINGTNFEPQDITEWNKHFDNIDLIMHGSPCQDFSLAGKQAGGDEGSGTRSSLMYETIRIVKDIKPKYVVWENVKNLLSKKHKHNFDAYIEAMNELGYTSYYKVLNAKDFGIPQNRERVFTVSIRKDLIVYDDYNSTVRNDQDTIGTLTCNCGAGAVRNGWKIIEKNKPFVFPEPFELTKKLKDFLEPEVDEKYYLSDKKIGAILNWKAYQKPLEKVLGRESISPTLTARGAGEEHSGMITLSESLENTTNLQEKLGGEYLPIKVANSKGYQEAYEGDSVNISYP